MIVQKRSRIRRALLAAAAVGAAVVMVAPAASAAPVAPAVDAPISAFPGVDGCPAETAFCVAIVVKGGAFVTPGFDVEIPPGGITIKGGLSADLSTFTTKAGSGSGVEAPPLVVPGGILGRDLPFNNLFGLNDLSVQLQILGTPQINLATVGVTLNARIKLNNPLLGDHCFVGTDDFPVAIQLNSTKTLGELLVGAVTPVEGAPAGTVGLTNIPSAAEAFPLPPASGCGPFDVLDGLVNLRGHLPSDGTGNSLTTVSDAFLGANTTSPQQSAS